jgi:hypothetical protein
VSRSRFPWILAGILLVSLAAWGVTGLALASAGSAAAYYVSLRRHPRTRHRACNGTGEVRGAVFTWTFRKCPRCAGGRLIRWGAGQWGPAHIRAENTRGRQSRAKARQDRTSR